MKNLITVILCCLVALMATKIILNRIHPLSSERISNFVGYSQSCWQEGNVLHVVTAKGDTVRLDISRLEGEQ